MDFFATGTRVFNSYGTAGWTPWKGFFLEMKEIEISRRKVNMPAKLKPSIKKGRRMNKIK